jgi:hypothetical protein
LAIAAPMPLDAPVTTATLPLNLLISVYLLSHFWIRFLDRITSIVQNYDPRCARTVLGLADTFNNESVIDRPVFAVLGDALRPIVWF